jgi:predicted aspartyl protease
MAMRHHFLLLLTVFSIHSLQADIVPEAAIPFELKQHLIVIRASIGNVHDIELALDTGASTTVLSPKLAKRLQLKDERKREVLILGKKMKIKEFELPRLCLGDICHEHTVARVSSLHAVPVDGLLGLDVLKKTSFTIDFVSQQIRFGTVIHSGSSQKFVPQLPFLMTRVRIGEKTLCLLLDSGCGDLILFQRRVGDSLIMDRTGQKIPLEGSGAKAKAEMVYLEGVSLGDCRWKSLRAFLLNDRKTDQYGTLDGILGLGSLDIRQIAFDFDHNQISWQQ